MLSTSSLLSTNYSVRCYRRVRLVKFFTSVNLGVEQGEQLWVVGFLLWVLMLWVVGWLLCVLYRVVARGVLP
jgi:hypothetical protein